MTDNTIVFHEPVRPGDRLRTRQILRSVSEPKTTKLGNRAFLGDRGRVSEPEGRAGRRRVLTPASATGEVTHDFDHTKLALADVHVGDTLSELAYPVTATDDRARRARGARLADRCTTTTTSASIATHQGHLHEHAEPGAWFERFLTDCRGQEAGSGA